ncbi:DUF7133 domain-containing protein [Parapedobacter sp. 10938]|uniref:DUF7133 domain-containing protein n=1 Tax=Parapedobacter flavus TaxID=3110225 RepID=UPI002DBB1EE9|nr:c-type cytochrome [Parapedobacter sp. 10938]MEC3881357.1 c-type cytochrome [Parapedobacter sp. 10938]
MEIKRIGNLQRRYIGSKQALCFFATAVIFAVGGLLKGCKEKDGDGVLSPRASLKAMEVEAGFDVELVAAEPLVMAPVAMTFDEKGRIWVVEMEGYMPDTLGDGEDAPIGRIVMLTDQDGDGKMDERNVFLDSLVMPRAICLVDSGLLLAEPPKLWFYEIREDKPTGRILVDSAYAEGGNVEHQPNGLLRGLDNWIYSAKYDWRYRRLPDGEWQKEKTHFRGQWGISQDNWGRLYYNDNSSNLSGDYFPPGLGSSNPNQRKVAGYRETIVADTRVYPIHPTTGVNRGYMENVLDSTGHLVNFTAACGPLVYRGGLLPGINAFVAEPAANLVKRDVLVEEGYRTVGEQAYGGKEFLASRDERFRPVNLYDGPDGALYIVDMYRGIIQHSTYLTPYLKNEIEARELTVPLDMGRIYRVMPKGAERYWTTMPQGADSLIALLGHANGWVRDKAQQVLVDRHATDVVGKLREILRSGRNHVQVVHALWTLEGLTELNLADIQAVLERPQWQLRAQAIAAAVSLASTVPQKELADMITAHVSNRDTLLMPYAALAMAAFADLEDTASEQWALKYPNNKYLADALVSGLGGREQPFLKEIAEQLPDTTSALYHRVSTVVDDIAAKEKQGNQRLLAERYPQGIALFQNTCQPCHGEDGRGVSPIAPPLAGSQWVTGDEQRLMALVLYGLTGAVDVAGHTYEAPEVSGEMPGIAHNTTIDDAELAQLLSYIRNAWGNAAGDEVLPEDLGAIRSTFGKRTEPFTQVELYQLFGKD